MSGARALGAQGSVVVTGPTITAIVVAAIDHYAQLITHHPADPWTLMLLTVAVGSVLSAVVLWLHGKGIDLPDPNQPIVEGQPVTLTQHYTLTAPPTVTMSAPTQGGAPSGH